jgi:Bacterial regulatory proteins, luxR family
VRDRVAVQGAEGSRDHADVQATALPSGQDLGGEDVIGGAEARAERRGRKRDRRAHSWCGARVGQRGGRESWPGAGDGELARQRRALLLAGGVFDGVEPKKRVQLRAMVSTSRVLAEEKRRVAEIGQRLYIGETTVKTHVTHILQKLGLRDRIQAVVLTYQTGLFEGRTTAQ